MEDHINRSDAIERIVRFFNEEDMMEDKMPNERINKWRASVVFEDIPSAEKQGEWIPCSERLPDATGFYLCTVNRDTPNVKTMKFELLVGDEYRWMLMNGTEAFPRFVIAWMPLPEPWKGADDND